MEAGEEQREKCVEECERKYCVKPSSGSIGMLCETRYWHCRLDCGDERALDELILLMLL